ncbi:MAG: lipopolysaccharide biosynthesis protein [Verrucomicrobiae bacterium]|nr:lipopolysaccharide biosynthesis protein [Verrucomicrobiae bacterium]
MSISRRILFGAAASWFSRGLTILLGLILMPVLFRTLPKEELGLWLLIGQSAAILGVLDFGFGITLTRRLAFARGKSGSDPTAPFTEESRSEIADLVATGIRLYRLLAVGAFVISFGLGLYYLRTLELESVALRTVWTAWGVLCLSHALTVWATPWTCLLQGVGHVGWDALIASFTGAFTLLAQIVTALAGGGIVALAAVAAAGAILQRATILGFARRKQPELFSLRGRWRGDWFKEMAPYAWRAWLTAMGTILVQNTDNLFIASARGVESVPAFRAAFLVVLNLHMLAGVFATSSSVFISHLWQAGDLEEVRKILWRNLRLGLAVVGCGGAAVLTGGEAIFNLWLGPGNYIGPLIILLFAVSFILEQQSYVLSTSCRATEDEAFAMVTLLGGTLKIGLSLIGLKLFGLAGLAGANLVAQLLAVHWFVVWRSLRRLGIEVSTYVREIAIPATVFIGVALILCISASWFTQSTTDTVKLAAVSAAGGLVFLSAVWSSVLNSAQRSRLIRAVGTCLFRSGKCWR